MLLLLCALQPAGCIERKQAAAVAGATQQCNEVGPAADRGNQLLNSVQIGKFCLY